MRKKDYEFLIDCLALQAFTMAKELSRDNPKFDRGQFYRAILQRIQHDMENHDAHPPSR